MAWAPTLDLELGIRASLSSAGTPWLLENASVGTEHRGLCSSLSPGPRHSIALLPPQKVRLRGEQSSYPVDGPFCHRETGTGNILFNANEALLQKAEPID